MKIGFVVPHLSHGSPGSFVRIQEISKHLNNAGIEVTILTPFEEDIKNVPDINIELIPSTMSSIGLTTMTYKLARRMAALPFTSGFFLSASSIAKMANTIERGMVQVLKRRRFDILHAIQPVGAIACAALAKEHNIPLISDLHNIIPEEIVAQNLCKKGDRVYNAWHDAEQQAIDVSDAVTVVSEQMKKYMNTNYSTANKPITVVPPCGPIISGADAANRERKVVYAGMVNVREHVDLFAKSIPLVGETASFYISDYGDSLKTVKDITSKIDHKVNYVWFKRRLDVIDHLLRAKVGILTSQDHITRQLGPPLKLYDYMACGIPVVANDIGGWSKMIADEQIGLLSEDNPQHFAECIDNLLSDKSMWDEMHNNSLRLIRTKYNWNAVTKDILIPLYEQLRGITSN